MRTAIVVVFSVVAVVLFITVAITVISTIDMSNGSIGNSGGSGNKRRREDPDTPYPSAIESLPLVTRQKFNRIGDVVSCTLNMIVFQTCISDMLRNKIDEFDQTIWNYTKECVQVALDKAINHSSVSAVLATNKSDNVDGMDNETIDIEQRNEEYIETDVQTDAEGNTTTTSSTTISKTSSTTKRSSSALQPGKPVDNVVLCESSAILFVGEPNTQVQQDVIDSMVLAHLNAEHKLIDYKSKKDMPQDAASSMKYWFEQFQSTFKHMRWVDSGFEVAEAKTSGNDLSVDKVVLDIIDSIGNEEEKNKFKKAMEVMKAMPKSDNRLALFRQKAQQRDMCQFLVHLVFIDKRGSATMKSTIIALSTKQNVTDVLWFRWSDGETKIYKSEHTMILNSHSFDAMRSTIQQKIQKINETFINKIPLE